MNDPVNHPSHYTSHPSGVEVIQITEHMNFCLGNAVKYILRADHKGNAVQDLEKAAWYIKREIERRETALLDEAIEETREERGDPWKTPVPGFQRYNPSTGEYEGDHESVYDWD